MENHPSGKARWDFPWPGLWKLSDLCDYLQPTQKTLWAFIAFPFQTVGSVTSTAGDSLAKTLRIPFSRKAGHREIHLVLTAYFSVL